MTAPLSAEQLERLRRYNTPTISNAIEVFNVRPRHQGFLPHQVRCLLPAETRERLWAELRSGANPEQARERVPLPEEAGRP